MFLLSDSQLLEVAFFELCKAFPFKLLFNDKCIFLKFGYEILNLWMTFSCLLYCSYLSPLPLHLPNSPIIFLLSSSFSSIFPFHFYTTCALLSSPPLRNLLPHGLVFVSWILQVLQAHYTK